MKTAVISDLHLGAGSNADVLRRPEIRDAMLTAAAECDELVLLGDIVELRDGPIGQALDASRGFFESLAGNFNRVVLVPGNHDHRLLGNWIERRLGEEEPSVDLAAVVGTPHPAVSAIADWLGSSQLEVRYPGYWIRDDVFATHGHYLDSHVTLPTVERLSVAAIDRLGGKVTGQRDTPDDYEHRHAPVYDLLFNLAQGPRTASSDDGRPPSMRLWELVGGASGRARTIRGKLLGSAVIPATLGALERTGFGQFNRDFSLGEIGRAGANAMHVVVRSLEIDAEYVIFGHIHRRGPLAGEDGTHASHPDWVRGRTSLFNTGCWLYVPAMLGRTSAQSPFWPGRLTIVGPEGPPEAVEVLADAEHGELAAPLTQ